jgi:hypothetical protein
MRETGCENIDTLLRRRAEIESEVVRKQAELSVVEARIVRALMEDAEKPGYLDWATLSGAG